MFASPSCCPVSVCRCCDCCPGGGDSSVGAGGRADRAGPDLGGERQGVGHPAPPQRQGGRRRVVHGRGRQRRGHPVRCNQPRPLRSGDRSVRLGLAPQRQRFGERAGNGWRPAVPRRRVQQGRRRQPGQAGCRHAEQRRARTRLGGPQARRPGRRHAAQRRRALRGRQLEHRHVGHHDLCPGEGGEGQRLDRCLRHGVPADRQPDPERRAAERAGLGASRAEQRQCRARRGLRGHQRGGVHAANRRRRSRHRHPGSRLPVQAQQRHQYGNHP